MRYLGIVNAVLTLPEGFVSHSIPVLRAFKAFPKALQ